MCSHSPKKTILKSVEILLFALLIGYLYFYVDWVHLAEILAQANITFITLAVAFYSVKIYTESLRWQQLMKLYNLKVSIFRVIKLICITPFFGILAIVPKADELYFFYFLKQETSENSTVLSLMITNKVIALLSLFSLLPFAIIYLSINNLMFTFDSYKIVTSLVWLAILVPLMTIIFVILYRKPKIKNFIQKTLSELKTSFSYLKYRPLELLKFIFITYLGYLAYAFVIYFLCLALAVEIPIIALFLSIPIVYFFTYFMVGLKGIGVRETLWGFIFILFDISYNNALALSSLHLILSLFFIFIGLLFYLTNKQKYGAEKTI